MIGLKHDDVIKNSLDLSYYFINFLEHHCYHCQGLTDSRFMIMIYGQKAI